MICLDGERSVLWMESLRREGLFCDCVLVANDGAEFRVHRSTMAAASPFLRQRFVYGTNGLSNVSNSSNNNSNLMAEGDHLTENLVTPENPQLIKTGIEAKLLSKVIDFVYGGELELFEFGDVELLVPVASRLMISKLMTRCFRFLVDQAKAENCVGIWLYAKYFNAEETDQIFDIVTYLAIDASSLKHRGEWPMLKLDDLVAILSSDRLKIDGESDTWTMAKRWIEADLDRRREHVPLLVRLVRLEAHDLKALLTGDALFSHQINQLPNLTPANLSPRLPRDVILVVGGWSEGAPVNTMNAFDRVSNTWHSLAEYHDRRPRAYHSMIVLGQKVYLIGGYDGSEFYNSTRCWNAATGQWTEAAPMHQARCYISAVALEGKVYACGGFDGHSRLRTVERFDPLTNQWTMIREMNRLRSDASAAVLNGKIYVAGGFTGDLVLGSVEVFIVATGVWVEVCEMHSPRSGLSLIVFEQKLLAIGGFNGTRRLGSVEEMDPSTHNWVVKSEMVTPRSNFAVSSIGHELFVIGGYDGASTTALCERFSIETGQWRPVESLQQSRSAAKAVTMVDCRLIETVIVRNRAVQVVADQQVGQVAPGG